MTNQSSKILFQLPPQHQKHPLDPDLVYEQKFLPLNLEQEIKEGFFELRQKFKSAGASSIYISHLVLHEKHPIFCKLQMQTLKRLLMSSSIIQLTKGQTLYKVGQTDLNIYFALFGCVDLVIKNNSDAILEQSQYSRSIGQVKLGSTIGEEILFDINL